ncbi:host cell division inhibitor Icd-like protein [Salmonella enterica]|uniref:Host cell division inhibitor Icd-like protein n=1 Tax=Salmonella senftenberg TaxID=28150 RepID=A0A5T6QA53_SALSE|nr:host cell division inhibitor Icd-like protein [Salmonella enterica]EBS5223717.1 host cell division inhibitor Icd-like protein [Salmonella enterica subsp. enterica serovar Montevideo]EAP0557967.1 host cell division inhibitor Icd-like protein [Salmonella enterica]EBA3548802.1 host cell division inhibitor Icd-like protein [Salmonella enterica]EBA3800745.1 host cell division inhibitor Icd-like protein [Salmonella enterica]EBA5466811.1 host cell division inhibitor Icd-like protein [Salmonella en
MMTFVTSTREGILQAGMRVFRAENLSKPDIVRANDVCPQSGARSFAASTHAREGYFSDIVENASTMGARSVDDLSDIGGIAGINAPANASSSFSRRGDEESFETSTRTREGEFLESIKKGLPTIANPVYGYSAPAKSGAGIGVLQLSTAHNRAKCGFFVCVARLHPSMVGWARASKDAPVSVEAGTPTSFSSPPVIGVFGGDFKHHSTEAAAMLATIPTQNPQFIWLIAAVRRDMPTITAKIHHIAAETEHEARRTLARDHVCFFAGRIRLEVAA